MAFVVLPLLRTDEKHAIILRAMPKEFMAQVFTRNLLLGGPTDFF
jgi:hypothetical protein